MYNIICALAHFKYAFLDTGVIGTIEALTSRFGISNRYSINND